MLAYFVQQAGYQILEHLTHHLEEGGSRTVCHRRLVLFKDVHNTVLFIHIFILTHSFIIHFHVLEASVIGLITKVSIFQVNATLLICLLLILIALQVSVFIVAAQSEHFAIIVVKSID